MRELIHRENIKHFRALLETESDEAKREIILKLLVEEEAKEDAASNRYVPKARTI